MTGDSKRRPAWALVTALGVALIGLGALVAMSGTFSPSGAGTIQFGYAFVLFGVVVTSGGVVTRLLLERQ